MRESKCTNIGTPEVQRVTNPGAKHSEIGVKLSDIEQVPHQVGQKLRSVQKSKYIKLSGNRDFAAHGITEPCMKKGKQGESTAKYQAVNLFRAPEIRNMQLS